MLVRTEAGHGDREKDNFEGPGQPGKRHCITSLVFQNVRQSTRNSGVLVFYSRGFPTFPDQMTAGPGMNPGRTIRRGLAAAMNAGGKRCLVLSDPGLAFLARRDRSAVGAARRRWSAALLDPAAGLDWRNVYGSRSRQLLRNLEHTQAVHQFLAALSDQSRSLGCELAQLDPPRRANRFFRRDDRLHSVRPDAFGVLRRDGREQPFFLEWERRAVRPTTMAARIAPYLRYYAAPRSLDDHGVIPAVLVVFDDDIIAVGHFVRVADNEMRRAGVKVPLWMSHKAALEKLGPLGAAWRKPGSFRPECAF